MRSGRSHETTTPARWKYKQPTTFHSWASCSNRQSFTTSDVHSLLRPSCHIIFTLQTPLETIVYILRRDTRSISLLQHRLPSLTLQPPRDPRNPGSIASPDANNSPTETCTYYALPHVKSNNDAPSFHIVDTFDILYPHPHRERPLPSLDATYGSFDILRPFKLSLNSSLLSAVKQTPSLQVFPIKTWCGCQPTPRFPGDGRQRVVWRRRTSGWLDPGG